MLMMECCRSIGLPARFVSGYHLADPAPERYDLHAWTEVYLPGAGWRGFDPSAGGEISDRYIALASSSKPDLAAAIQGTFSGPVATGSTLDWLITAAIEPDLPSEHPKDAVAMLGRRPQTPWFRPPEEPARRRAGGVSSP